MEQDKFYKFIGEIAATSDFVIKGSCDGSVSISGFVTSCTTDLKYAFNIKVYQNNTWEFLSSRTSLKLYKEASINTLPFALSDTMQEYGFYCEPINIQKHNKSKRKRKSRIKKDVKKLIKDIKKSD